MLKLKISWFFIVAMILCTVFVIAIYESQTDYASYQEREMIGNMITGRNPEVIDSLRIPKDTSNVLKISMNKELKLGYSTIENLSNLAYKQQEGFLYFTNCVLISVVSGLSTLLMIIFGIYHHYEDYS